MQLTGLPFVKNPYFSVSGKMSVQRAKIIGERTETQNHIPKKAVVYRVNSCLNSSGSFLFKLYFRELPAPFYNG